MNMDGNPNDKIPANNGSCVDKMASSPLLGPAKLSIVGVKPRRMSADARLLWIDCVTLVSRQSTTAAQTAP